MRRRRRYLLVLCAVGLALVGALAYGLRRAAADIKDYRSVTRRAGVTPDYADAVIPPNIAPLNFVVEEPGTLYCVKFRSTNGEGIDVVARGPQIVIPPRPWRRLLDANRGEELSIDVYVKAADGRWDRFEPMTNAIAREEIDRYLVYRLINAGFNMYVRMGIYERDLEDYDESLILDNRSFDEGCMNCHTFLSKGTDGVVFQMRPGREDHGMGMVLIRDGHVTIVDTRTHLTLSSAVYSSWHPSGRALAFSMNKVRQFFHGSGSEVRDVLDLDSDLALYLLESGALASTPAIREPDRLETYPAWSPDGKYLYFCSAPILWSDRNEVPPAQYDQVRYELRRIGYEIETGAWGEVETVLSAERTGLSISLPKVSPDGRFLLFCMAEYGCFPIHLASSDLYMMELDSGRYERLDISSDQSDSWHSWSSNGRWIVFSSRRRDGLLTRLYLSYVDETGKAHRPFLLPQKDPAFYDSFLKTYNVPELVREPVPVRGEQIARVMRSGQWVKSDLAVTSATPAAGRGPDVGPAGAREAAGPWSPRSAD